MASIFLALSDIIMAEIYMLLLKQRYLTDSIPDAKSGWCFPDSLRIVKFNVFSMASGKILTLQCTPLQKEIITHYNGVYDTSQRIKRHSRHKRTRLLAGGVCGLRRFCAGGTGGAHHIRINHLRSHVAYSRYSPKKWAVNIVPEKLHLSNKNIQHRRGS